MNYFPLAIACLLYSIPLAGQDNRLFYDEVLDNDICAVRLKLTGLPVSLPVADVNAANGTLMLEFDHLGDAIMDYEYTIVHCNSDWMPSQLDPTEYINGYPEDRITQFEPSFNTLQQYTHYKLSLPNANFRWTQSGNYILKVWDSANDDRLVFTRRFMVVEPAPWRIQTEFVRTARVNKSDTHHELDIKITPKNVRISNPQNEVKTFILQNGRWGSAIGPLGPFITRGDDLIYDYQDVIVFPAGKEFRFFDMRTFDIRGEGIRIIDRKDGYYEVTLQRDISRLNRPNISRNDADGAYVIANNNVNQTMLQCDYAEVLFSLSRNLPFDDADVYVIGELTDWQLKPEFKMKYNEETQAYFCTPYLKQGYYNYQYVLVDRRTGKPDSEELEGDWYETENSYTVLTYFRPFGARFDKLVAASTVKSTLGR